MPREYDKLVRDEIPAVIEDNGEEPITHTADDEEYRRRLQEKLDEEVAEFRESDDPEELADVLEVVFALANLHSVSEAEIQERREAKAEERGRFEDGIVLEAVHERDS